MFIDSGKVTSTWGKEPPVMTTRVELKREAAREEWKNLLLRVGEEPRKFEQKSHQKFKARDLRRGGC